MNLVNSYCFWNFQFQVIPVPSDTSVLQDTLVNKNIILNVFSTYPKLKSRKVIGIDWESRVISPRNNLQELKDLPKVYC